MMRSVCLAGLLVAISVAISAPLQQSENQVSYPGGSPFPPGAEPSLTHTATIFWTTESGLTTEIQIVVPGERPTQLSCWETIDEEQKYLASSISPDCNYHFVFTKTHAKTPENVARIVADGKGCVEVRVYGFKREDFDNPPIVNASYSQGGKVVGETKLLSHPLPENFKEAEPPS